MIKKSEETKLGWYEEFKEGMQEINATNVLKVIRKIEEVEGKETQEKADELNALIAELELTEEESQQIFSKFSKDVVAFKGSMDSLRFIKNKLKRKARLIENRISRSLSGEFADYVKKLRKDQGFSLKDVERMTGISVSYVNRIEKGERKAPSYPIIEKMATAYGVPVGDLLQIAGVANDELNIQGVPQLIYSNPFTINGSMTSTKQKEAIVELLETMDSVEWNDETKHMDTVNLINLISKYKNLS